MSFSTTKNWISWAYNRIICCQIFLETMSSSSLKQKNNKHFRHLKKLFCSQPVLKLYIVGVETELHTDASKHGYGAILMQRNKDDNAFHPVCYTTGKPTPDKKKFDSYQLEVLAIVKALEKFQVYLWGTEFKIVTDCQAFTMASTDQADKQLMSTLQVKIRSLSLCWSKNAMIVLLLGWIELRGRTRIYHSY